ncbi:MAG: MerR family transcriptional regulator [Proteobacteria bacterium]|nr:MAG: MerR family transcriptional regulator [Pseudomonadota bacterium]
MPEIPAFNIAAVERDTGLSKDVLRMWERRYGFPTPGRDANGERSYPAEQVEHLRLIKRLMDQGHRPGKLLAASPEALAALAPKRKPVSDDASPDTEALDALLHHIRQHDATGFQQAMAHRLARQGLQRFVRDTVTELTRRVGEAWEDGRVEVFEEHLYTELTERLLRQALATVPGGPQQPRIILTSVPNEEHGLGLLMVEALLTLEGAECIPLGTQMPLLDIARAAQAHRADIVALSFSSAFPQRQVAGLLSQLRGALPPGTELWVGGGGVARSADSAGVRVLHQLDDIAAALAHWRAGHAA